MLLTINQLLTLLNKSDLNPDTFHIIYEYALNLIPVEFCCEKNYCFHNNFYVCTD